MDNSEVPQMSNEERKCIVRFGHEMRYGFYNYMENYSTLLCLKKKFPDHSGIAFCFLRATLDRCDFEEYKELVQEFKKLVIRDASKERVSWTDIVGLDAFIPFYADFSGEDCRLIVEMLYRHNDPVIAPISLRIHEKLVRQTEKITVGYASSTFMDHGTSHLMMDIPATHNKACFNVVCYDTSNPELDEDSEDIMIRKVIEDGSSKFIRLKNKLSDVEKANHIRKDECHIIVSLDGQLDCTFLSVINHRPAPLSITMFGYPGSSGRHSMDYVLVDERVVPNKYENWMTEKLVYHPICCFVGSHKHMYPNVTYSTRIDGNEKGQQIVLSSSCVIPEMVQNIDTFASLNVMFKEEMQCIVNNGHTIHNGAFLIPTDERVIHDMQSLIVTKRQDYGLPDGSLVFATFKKFYIHDPDMIRAWEMILKAVPNAIIWFCCSNPDLHYRHHISNIIDPELKDRLLFSSVVGNQERVRMGLLVDLMLDTWMCNVHITSLNALWSGAPILTLQGNNYHTRITSSLLYALQLPVLVTTTKDEYVERAIWLGQNPFALATLRDEINIRKLSYPLFDVRQFTSFLEVAYKRMWENFLQGRSPAHIHPEPGHDSWMKRLSPIDLKMLQTKISTNVSDDFAVNDMPEDGVVSPLPLCSSLESQFTLSDTDDTTPIEINAEITSRIPSSEKVIAQGSRPKRLVNISESKPASLAPVVRNLALTQDFSETSNSKSIKDKYSKPVTVFSRHVIIFSVPENLDVPNCGIPGNFYHGQKGVNLVALETGVHTVLDSLLDDRNMSITCMGEIMANQFIQRLQEYFDDGLPAMPSSMNECSPFFCSPRGLLFSTPDQLAWFHSFYNLADGMNMEPEFKSKNIFQMQWKTERRQFDMPCCLCVNMPGVPAMMHADTIVTSHYKKYHTGELYIAQKITCPACGKDISLLSSVAREKHKNNHIPVPDCKEMYYQDGEDELTVPSSVPFTVNLDESFEEAANRYVREAKDGGLNIRKFFKAQRMATFTTWLAPACNLVLAHLKKNPSMISGTSYIGYQFKALLQCHLRTKPLIIVPNLTSMPLQMRVNFCTTNFKFHGMDLMYKMQRAFVDSATMDELRWVTTSHGAQGVVDPQCKMCGNERKVVPKNFTSVLTKDHLFPEKLPVENVCGLCGFYYNSEETRQIHATHNADGLPSWKEEILKVVDGISISSIQTIQLM